MADDLGCCPECGCPNLTPWMRRYKCDDCGGAFHRRQLVKEALPKMRRPTRSISDRQEKRNAKAVGGRRTIASGSTPVDKGDVKAKGLRMECKSTARKSIGVKKEDLEKIAAQAKDDEIPVFAIEYRGDPDKEYYVIQKDWFLQLWEAHRRDSDDS